MILIVSTVSNSMELYSNSLLVPQNLIQLGPLIINSLTPTYSFLLGCPARMTWFAFYGSDTNHLSRLPGQDPGSRWSSVQYSPSTRHLGRVNNHISYF
jgi:hypothetical protein